MNFISEPISTEPFVDFIWKKEPILYLDAYGIICKKKGILVSSELLTTVWRSTYFASESRYKDMDVRMTKVKNVLHTYRLFHR